VNSWSGCRDDIRFADITRNATGGTYWPSDVNIQDLLADYFEIDRDKIEEEKLAMLKGIRERNVEDAKR